MQREKIIPEVENTTEPPTLFVESGPEWTTSYHWETIWSYIHQILSPSGPDEQKRPGTKNVFETELFLEPTGVSCIKNAINSLWLVKDNPKTKTSTLTLDLDF